MIETILEEIRVLNLPLFWLTESEHGKRTTWSFVPDNPCNDIYSVTKVFTVTALSGEKLDDFLRPRLLMPLHVREAAFSKCPMGYPIGATGMYVRTEDMAKLGEVYQNGGTFEGKHLLSKEWVELVFEREYELAKMENGGHCKGGMNGQMLYLSPHGRVIAWQSYDPEGKGNTLMELILKNE